MSEVQATYQVGDPGDESRHLTQRYGPGIRDAVRASVAAMRPTEAEMAAAIREYATVQAELAALARSVYPSRIAGEAARTRLAAAGRVLGDLAARLPAEPFEAREITGEVR